MTETVVSAAVRAKQWDDTAFKEYVRANRFKRYMGTSENSIIQVKNDLTKKQGDAITINLVGALDSASGPNDGSTTLVGAEKELPNQGHKVTVKVVRDAVVVNTEEEQASPFAIRDAGKVALKDLAMRYLRNDILAALSSVHGTPYALANASLRNQWNAANSDRVLYGDDIGNYNATMSSALTAIAAGEKLSKANVSKLKRIAQAAKSANGDGIRPFRFGQDEEAYVLFVDRLSFRDLKIDMGTELRDAMKRGESNPLFSGTTSLEWDGVVVREIPEIASLGQVGAGGTVYVSPAYLCGAQALAVAWAKTLKSTIRKEDDYGFRHGLGFFEMRGVEKVLWKQGETTAKDWGMATGFFAAAPDA
jgi:N4-gp56 family major capsid protein